MRPSMLSRVSSTVSRVCKCVCWCLAHVTGKKVEEEDDDGEETKLLEEMTEEERIAQLGKPRLGDTAKVTCHIRESMEFKVSIGMQACAEV